MRVYFVVGCIVILMHGALRRVATVETQRETRTQRQRQTDRDRQRRMIEKLSF